LALASCAQIWTSHAEPSEVVEQWDPLMVQEYILTAGVFSVERPCRYRKDRTLFLVPGLDLLSAWLF
jgi:hypothetical protein